MTTAAWLDQYYARQADQIDRGPQLYGGKAELVKLRCFKYYHPDVGSWMEDPAGRLRWLGPATSRVYAILHRLSSSGERSTMTAIAAEAMCCTSTVSRAVVKLQAYGMFAIDVIRGRNGGLSVRRRRVGDALASYARAAWARIRSWINVASLTPGTKTYVDEYGVPTDATFIARDGARVLAGEISIDEAIANTRARRGGSAPKDQRFDSQAFATAVYAERRRLAIIDPAGEADAIHPLW